jgi:ATP-dependent protease ClpP protease subunit
MNGTPWRTARRVMALSQNDWYRISSRSQETGAHQLHIYDEIGMLGVSASDLIDKLEGISGPLDVHLNSPGGEVFEGLAIYNCLLQRPDVTVYIDGMAASIASVIALAGSRTLIARSARMMVHDGFSMAIGNAADMRALADRLDFESDNIAQIYADHTGQSKSHWRDIMRQEKWYNSESAVEAGLAHGIIETRANPAPGVSANWDLTIYRNAGAVSNGLRNAAEHPYTSETGVMHEPMSGTHSHNHAAFGHDDGDDGIHHHAHTHDGDAAHGHGHFSHSHGHANDGPHRHAHELGQSHYGPHDHMHTHSGADPDHDGDNDATAAGDTDHDYWAAPTRNSVEEEYRNQLREHLDLHNASYDDSEWDGPAAMSAAAHSASPASALAAICAGRRSGDASTEEAHALPHHKRPGSPPNKHGVSAAIAALNGGRGGVNGLTNRDAAMAHLKAHAKAWAKGESGSDHDHSHGDILNSADWTDEDIAQFSQALKGAIQ